MKFRSRVSVILFGITLCVMAFACYRVILEGQVFPTILMATFTIITILIFWGIRYTIEDDKLYVGFLFIRGTCYDIKKLVSISPTRTLISSPAASLIRLKLDFGCGQPLIISPAAQDVFIEEILRINPNVTINC